MSPARSTFAPAVLLTLLALSQGAASQSPAPAPAPLGAAKPQVDGVFVLTAASAAFVNETTIAFAGLSTSTEWVKFPPQPAAGALPQFRLTSEHLISRSGMWAGRPQAALSGLANGQQTNILLQFDSPRYCPMSNTMMFQYEVLRANNTDLPAADGTVNDFAAQALQAGSEAHNRTVSAVMPGSMLYAVSVVMDIVGIEQYTTNVMARTEAGLIHVDLGANNYYGGGYFGK